MYRSATVHSITNRQQYDAKANHTVCISTLG